MSHLPEHSIFTFTGRRFWPLEPRPEDMVIEDIAHALSQQCRFTGHTKEFYSVAQHCVHVSKIVPPGDALWGLLHDATEAYLIDLARPVKMQMPEFKAVEKELERCVTRAFGLPSEMPKSVHEADNIMLMTEKRDLMPSSGEFSVIHSGLARPLEGKIEAWLPAKAKQMFLWRFRELTEPTRFQSCPSGLCGLPGQEEMLGEVAVAEAIANDPHWKP